jgi:hypothetical protein
MGGFFCSALAVTEQVLSSFQSAKELQLYELQNNVNVKNS